MRSLIPILLALACPIGMCAPMLMRRRGEQAGCHPAPSENEASELVLPQRQAGEDGRR